MNRDGIVWPPEKRPAVAMDSGNWTCTPPELNIQTLSRKTAEEVWRDLQRNRVLFGEESPQKWQRPSCLDNYAPNVGALGAEWRGEGVSPAATGGGGMDPSVGAIVDGSALAIPGELMDGYDLASDSQCRKRAPETIIEKTVERRRKRLMKNRESAARSRARKLAYTMELEAAAAQLKEENARLKQHQLLQNLTLVLFHREQNHVLRRTSTSPF